MGDVVKFLRARFAGTGFNNLAAEEIAAIQDYMLLWSSLEAEVVNSHANGFALVDQARRIGKAVQHQLGGIAAEMDYFRDRCWQNGAATVRAADLKLDR